MDEKAQAALLERVKDILEDLEGETLQPSASPVLAMAARVFVEKAWEVGEESSHRDAMSFHPQIVAQTLIELCDTGNEENEFTMDQKIFWLGVGYYLGDVEIRNIERVIKWMKQTEGFAG